MILLLVVVIIILAVWQTNSASEIEDLKRRVVKLEERVNALSPGWKKL